MPSIRNVLVAPGAVVSMEPKGPGRTVAKVRVEGLLCHNL